MAYDYQGAINAGAKQQDIINYLANQTGYRAQDAIKAGAKPEDVMKYMANLPSKQTAQTTQQNTTQTPSGSLSKGVVSDVATGVAKGIADNPRSAASLGLNIGSSDAFKTAFQAQHPLAMSLMNNVISPALKKFLSPNQLQSVHEALTGVQGGLQEGTQQTDFTRPTNTGQKVGFGAEKVGEFLIPGLGEESIAKNTAPLIENLPRAAQTAAKLAGKSAFEGASAAGVTALQSGGNKEEVKNAALTGAALPVVGVGLGKVGQAISDLLPKRIMQSVAGLSKTEMRAGKDVSDYMLQKTRFGTVNQLLDKSESSIEDLSNQINTKLSQAGESNVTHKVSDITQQVADKINEAGGATTKEEVHGIIHQLAPQARGLLAKEELTPIEANKLRQSIDKTLGDKGFLKDQLPYNKEVLKTFANDLRESVKSSAPEGTRGLFDELSKEITLRNSLINKYTGKEGGRILGFGDLVAALTGSIGGLPGAIAGYGLKKAAESPIVLTGAANTLNATKKLAPVIKTIAPVIKAGIIRNQQK